MRKVVLGLFLGLLLFTPLANSVAAGLVPCGGADEQPCQTCHVVTMVNLVVEWLVMILGIIAAIVIVYAGVKLVTSGGNSHAKEEAKSMMTNILIGYLIVLSGWLVVDYGLKALLIQDGGEFGVWNQVSCVDQPVMGFKTFEQDPVNWISVGMMDGSVVRNECSALPNGSFNCASQATACTAGGGTSEIDQTVTPWKVVCSYPAAGGSGGSGSGTYGGSCQVLSGGPCSVANLRPIFGDRAEDASRICNKESGGNAIESRSDICCGPNAQCSGAPSFSGGYFQVNILAHADLIPGCNLSSFFTRNGSTAQGECVRRNGNGICTGWSCSIVRNSAYNTCMQGARNSSINLNIAKTLYNSRGFDPWRNSKNLCSVR